MTSTPTTQDADEVELPDDLPEPDRTWVAALPFIGYDQPPERMKESRVKRGLKVYPVLHIDWAPLSFKYDFNPDVFPDNPNNYERQYLPFMTNDGQIMGSYTSFGKVFDAFKALGYALTKNSVFQPALQGKIFKLRNIEDGKWTDNNGVERPRWLPVPIEEIAAADYKAPTDPRVIKRGYTGGGGGIAKVEVTADQVAALKSALHGKTEGEYADAIFDSGNVLIMCDPFMAEAADQDKLTARMLGYGGKVMAGRILFEDVE